MTGIRVKSFACQNWVMTPVHDPKPPTSISDQRRLHRWHLGIVALVFSFCVAEPQSQDAGRLPPEIWLTTGAQPGSKLQPLGTIAWSSVGPTGPRVIVDTSVKYQVMSGFGAALNDASSYNIGRLPIADRQALLTDLFSRTGGIGLSYLRLPLGSSDFTWQTHYTYDDTCCDLHDFSVSKAEIYTIPIAQAAKALNPELRFMGSPWSAPAWMKENGALTCATAACKVLGGSYSLYADYLRKTVKAYAARGIPLDTLTVQNEPHNPPPSYPGTYYDWWDELNFVRVLGPRLAGTGVKLLSWDHNWFDAAAAANPNDPNDPNGNYGWYPRLTMSDPNGSQVLPWQRVAQLRRPAGHDDESA